MISKLIKNEEDIFLQTITDAVIDSNNNKTLSSIIAELEEKILNLVNENSNLKKQLSNLEQKVTEEDSKLSTQITNLEQSLTTKITEGDSKLNTQITNIKNRVDSLETNGNDYAARIQALENKTQKLGADGDFNKDIKAPRYFQK